jgi:hypothetical protein
VGSISTIQVAHVTVQSATDQARTITRHRRIELHKVIDMAFYSLRMGEISTVGWIEVPRDHLSDLMSGKRFPVPERCPDMARIGTIPQCTEAGIMHDSRAT